jgi:hypothetical protein
MDGHHILWLIKEKVPLFIIHSLTDHERDVPAICALPLSQGHSEAEQLDATRNGYEHVLLRQNQILNGYVGDQYINRNKKRELAREEAINWSSSHSQDCICLPYGLSLDAIVNKGDIENELPLPDHQPERSKFKLPEPEKQLIEDSWIPWIVPP